MRQVLLTPVLLIVALVCLPAIPACSASLSEGAAAFMQAQASDGFSGVVLISRAQQVVFEGAYGLANAEWHIPNSVHTKYRIGSITKQFTATLIMQLAEQDKLSVEDSICRFIEQCPAAWEPVTLRHLLAHTSGIPSYTSDPAFHAIHTLPRSHEQILSMIRDKPLEAQPGTEFKYSNSGYYLLGMVIEHVTGDSYEDVLRQRILQPLGMKDTGYDRSETLSSERAGGYVRSAGGQLANARYVDMSVPFSAGAMYSTAEDLERWNQALYGEVILRQKTLATMWTPGLGSYGMGWMVLPAHPLTFDTRMIFHGGDIDGFSASISRFPDRKVCVIVLSNIQGTNVEAIAHGLAAIALRTIRMP